MADKVVLDGFRTLSEPDATEWVRLEWFGDALPRKTDGTSPATGCFEASDTRLTVWAPPNKDYWRKTYYDPILIKDDGTLLYTELQKEKWWTIETHFAMEAKSQFDQAGLMVRLDHEHWIKTGIEVVDDVPRISCVVTNIYSDWSTQKTEASASDGDLIRVDLSIRIHCRGDSFVVEFRDRDGEWEFLRIANLSLSMERRADPLAGTPGSNGPSPPTDKIWAGIFVSSPNARNGTVMVEFNRLVVSEGSEFHHNADGNSM